MTHYGYTLTAYLLVAVMLWGYAAMLWFSNRMLRRRR